MIRKLEVEDVALHSKSAQLRRLIKREFGSYEALAEIMGIKASTLEQYLKQNKLGTDKFKTQLSNVFNYDVFTDLVDSEEYFRKLVEIFAESIKLHTDKEGQMVFFALKNLCNEQGYQNELFTLERCWAWIEIYNGIKSGVDKLESLAVTLSTEHKNGFFLQVYAEHAMTVAYVLNKPMLAHTMLSSVNLADYPHAEPTHMFTFVFAKALIQKMLEYTDEALETFMSILDIPNVKQYHLGKATMNIGNLYRDKKEYTLALTYYERALEQYKASNYISGVGIAYANMSHTYREQGDYDKMETAILSAMDLRSEILSFDQLPVVEEYVQYLKLKEDENFLQRLKWEIDGSLSRFNVEQYIIYALLEQLAITDTVGDDTIEYCKKFVDIGADREKTMAVIGLNTTVRKNIVI